jgi:hypothetical protein
MNCEKARHSLSMPVRLCLLDQTVIRDAQDPDTHATVWNRAAEAWQKAYPDRIEAVPRAQYIKGEDY